MAVVSLRDHSQFYTPPRLGSSSHPVSAGRAPRWHGVGIREGVDPLGKTAPSGWTAGAASRSSCSLLLPEGPRGQWVGSRLPAAGSRGETPSPSSLPGAAVLPSLSRSNPPAARPCVFFSGPALSPPGSEKKRWRWFPPAERVEMPTAECLEGLPRNFRWEGGKGGNGEMDFTAR